MNHRVGLIGIGLVGTALTEKLLASGWQVVGYDIDPAKCRHLEQLGGTAASGAADVARQCRQVILSLMTTAIVREVVEGPGGLLEATPPPQYIIDTSTGDPEGSAALAGRLRDRNVHYLDATISGSSREIRQRQGLFMVGGSKEDFEACRELLEALTDRMVYAGPSGSGAKSKLTVNLILGV